MKPLLIAISAATAVVGGVMAARSYREQGKQEQRVHDFNAEVSDRNAKVAEIESEQIKRVSDFEIAEWNKEVNRLQDSQRLAYGKLGWQMSGSPLAVMADTANRIEEEKNIRTYNAAVSSDRKIEEGVQHRLQGQLSTLYGQQARAAGSMKARTSLLGSATTLFKSFATA